MLRKLLEKISLNHIFPFLNWKNDLNQKNLKADFLAGLTGAVIVLPQGVAFALIAGLPPIYGLYTAMITPIIAALFGSSYHLISGPTTAISLVIHASISRFAEPTTDAFVELALLTTLIAGLIQLLFGVARLGALINLVSHTVVVGFTAGAAILIVTTQMKHFLGLNLPSGGSFIETWYNIGQHIKEIDLQVLMVSLSTLIVAFVFRNLNRQLPHLLLAMLAGGIIAVNIGGEAVGIKFIGALPSGLPTPSVPNLNLTAFKQTLPNAFAIALLGLIEAVAIARSIANKSGQNIDSNQEFIGQGLSNIIGSSFNCYAGSGSFTRSGLNYEAGAKTPMSAIFAALLLMLILLVAAPLAAFIPIPAMAGIIVLVGYNLIDISQIKQILKAGQSEKIILITTFLATLFTELEFAIYIGVLLSLLFFIRHTARPHIATMAPDPKHKHQELFYILRKPHLKECPQIKIIRLDGYLYFGAMEHIADFVRNLRDNNEQKFLLIWAVGIHYVDLDGAAWLAKEAKAWEENGGGLYIAGLKIIAQDALREGGYWDEIGDDHFFAFHQEAISAIYERLDNQICDNCSAKVFGTCRK